MITEDRIIEILNAMSTDNPIPVTAQELEEVEDFLACHPCEDFEDGEYIDMAESDLRHFRKHHSSFIQP